MSTVQATLGSPRLSVRSGEGPLVQPEAPTHFQQELDYDSLPLTGDTEIRSVGPDEPWFIRTVADAQEAHGVYMDRKEDAVLVLHEEVSGDVRVIDYAHRWTPEYRDILYAKLKDAERWLTTLFGEGPIPTTLLTLTAHQRDSEGNPRPPGEVLADLNEGWDKFRRVIRRATEGRRTEVFRVIEPHQSGYPHIHVLIFGVGNPTLQEKVMDMWVEKYGIGGREAHTQAVEVVRGRAAQVQNPAAYLMKYLSKTVVRKGGEQQQVDGFQAFAALLWVTGKRQYSVTEGLSGAMKSPKSDEPPTGQQWRFLGVAKGIVVGSFSDEPAEALVHHMTSAQWVPLPREVVQTDPIPTTLASW